MTNITIVISCVADNDIIFCRKKKKNDFMAMTAGKAAKEEWQK